MRSLLHEVELLLGASWCMEWGHILCRYRSNWSGNCVLKFVCREAWCQASLQQAGVCVMCADTSRLRHKVCTDLEDPCVWVLRVGVALESKVDAACVRTAKEEGPTGTFPYVVREGTRQRKDVPYVGKYRSGTGRVAPNLAITLIGARFHANDEVGDEVLGDPGSVRTGPVAASPFGSPR